jgi:phospholipid/cholesterol/gamma-HCH transport system ATP-binding protein
VNERGLIARSLHFGFGPAPLFSGLDIEVRPGEIVGLIGPPESGKSVLLKLLAGLLEASSGTVTLDGEAFTGKAEEARYPLRKHIGMVFQNTALFDFLNIFDNVAFPLRALVQAGATMHEDEIGARVKDRLASVGLSHTLASFPHELSGGMKKRAGIARATVTNPRYCFYDEPTAGLDPVTSAKIYALIRGFAEEDRAGALIISNEIDTLFAACHRVVMLYEGEIVYSGTPADLARAQHPAVVQFVRGANEGPL